MGQVLHGLDGVGEAPLSNTNLGHMSIFPICVAPGTSVFEHSHHGVEEVMIVNSGTGQLEIETECHEVCAGSLAIVPAGEFHALKNTGDDNLEMVVVINSNVDLETLVLRSREEHFGTAQAMTAADRRALAEIKETAGAMTSLLSEVRDELAALRVSQPKPRRRAASAAN